MASSSLAFQPRSIPQLSEEDILLAYEVEEERITSVLYHKLERVRLHPPDLLFQTDQAQLAERGETGGRRKS